MVFWFGTDSKKSSKQSREAKSVWPLNYVKVPSISFSLPQAVSPTYWAKIVLGRGSSALLRILGLATTNLLSFAWFLIFGDISVFKIAVVALALVVVGITYAGYGAYASFIGAIVMGLIAVLSSAVNSLFLRRDPKKSVATVPPRGSSWIYGGLFS
uniref:Polysacc_synt_C domain-containing protein n=1 Tax=Mesocestoides corti TaxID=53468 RepID=A0A5K3FY37_MESCO